MRVEYSRSTRAQQAGRYHLKDWLPKADTANWLRANLFENGTSGLMNKTIFEKRCKGRRISLVQEISSEES